jgi:hypothetical protein
VFDQLTFHAPVKKWAERCKGRPRYGRRALANIVDQISDIRSTNLGDMEISPCLDWPRGCQFDIDQMTAPTLLTRARHRCPELQQAFSLGPAAILLLFQGYVSICDPGEFLLGPCFDDLSFGEARATLCKASRNKA